MSRRSRVAAATTSLMSAGCVALLARSAACQTLAPRAVVGLEAADSLVSAEFAKDSIGSLTVGVVAGARLAWTRSIGFADVKARRLADRHTVYRIGSVTKPFTAVMLLQLVAAGRVQLSDPVERYLPEVRQIAAKPPGAAPFTFLQLATMTAGLAREPDDAGPFWTGPVSAWETTLLAALPDTRYASVPGTEYAYSNVGYAVLGAALARAAGQPYVDRERSSPSRSWTTRSAAWWRRTPSCRPGTGWGSWRCSAMATPSTGIAGASRVTGRRCTTTGRCNSAWWSSGTSTAASRILMAAGDGGARTFVPTPGPGPMHGAPGRFASASAASSPAASRRPGRRARARTRGISFRCGRRGGQSGVGDAQRARGAWAGPCGWPGSRSAPPA